MNIRQPIPLVPQNPLDTLFEETEPARLPRSEAGTHSGWSYPEAEVVDGDGFWDVRLFIPGLEHKSVMVEVGENMLVLSGLRWNRPANGDEERLSPFRRLVDLPEPVREEKWKMSCHAGLLSLRLVSAERVRA